MQKAPYVPPPEPERPPVGEDHILAFPAVPPPMPIAEHRPGAGKPRRRTLVVAPVAVLMRDDARPWLRRLIEAQRTAGARAVGADIEILPDAEALVDRELDRLVAEGTIGTMDGRKTRVTRGVRLARSSAEWNAIYRARTQAQFDVRHRLIGHSVPDNLRVPLTVRDASVSAGGSIEFGGISHSVLVSAAEFARLFYGQYDQLVFLTAETGKSRVVRRERRGPKCWVVVFPDEDQGTDWPQRLPA